MDDKLKTQNMVRDWTKLLERNLNRGMANRQNWGHAVGTSVRARDDDFRVPGPSRPVGAGGLSSLCRGVVFGGASQRSSEVFRHGDVGVDALPLVDALGSLHQGLVDERQQLFLGQQ